LDSVVIATTTSLPIDQTPILETLIHRRAQVLHPHPVPPPEWQPEDVETRRFPAEDGGDEADGDG
jgi:hypothetical protein